MPKDSVRVSIPGCTKGYIFTAGRRTADQPGSVDIPEGILLVGPPSAAALVLDRVLNTDFLPRHLFNEMLKAVSVGGPFHDRPTVAPSYGLALMIDEQNPQGTLEAHLQALAGNNR